MEITWLRPTWSCKALEPEDACPTALTQAGPVRSAFKNNEGSRHLHCVQMRSHEKPVFIVM